MKVGSRVLITAGWSSFHHRRGVITQLDPYLMVLLDGEAKPLRMGVRELIVDPENNRASFLKTVLNALTWFCRRLV
jgi:hypothetical protein